MPAKREPLRRQAHQDVTTDQPPHIGRDVLTTDEWHVVAVRLKLSEREVQVIHGVFDSLSDSAIADQLGISKHTVHTHLWRLYRKLFVRNRCGLIVRVFWESRALPFDSNSA